VTAAQKAAIASGADEAANGAQGLAEEVSRLASAVEFGEGAVGLQVGIRAVVRPHGQGSGY
jgi:hypothetical protein